MKKKNGNFDYAQIAEILEKQECTCLAMNTGSGCFFEIFKKSMSFKKIAVFDSIDEIYEQDDFIVTGRMNLRWDRQSRTFGEEITTRRKKQNEDIIIPYQISRIPTIKPRRFVWKDGQIKMKIKEGIHDRAYVVVYAL